ncbi:MULTISPECIES: hypothetical protein [unclassified Shinella]|uniref:hypothetical protein n=1 Tax=unclassified Shinella TaxID=2643062 RepID=UPI00234E3B79|nr:MULTISPECIES: hypothetical protein [unclassified Shinella]MCO5152538.1 hypothetical protein [Shinella sp.]MDC7261831.1 hypothetical protein [Shinella sp. HY16]MDC7268726.1 hypothetical protein [Shinella sp. YZ44]
MTFDVNTLKRLAYFLANTDMSELVEAGVITEGNDDQWKRFNNDFDVFVIKLNDDRRQRLCDLINDRLGLRASVLEAAE